MRNTIFLLNIIFRNFKKNVIKHNYLRSVWNNFIFMFSYKYSKNYIADKFLVKFDIILNLYITIKRNIFSLSFVYIFILNSIHFKVLNIAYIQLMSHVSRNIFVLVLHRNFPKFVFPKNTCAILV